MCLVCTVHEIEFERIYLRYRPHAHAQTIATWLVCTLHSNCLTAFICGTTRVAGPEESFKQRPRSAWFMPFRLTAFISGLSRVRGLKNRQTIAKYLVFTFYSNYLTAFISSISRVASFKEPFKKGAWTASLKTLVYQWYMPRARSHKIVKQLQRDWSATFISIVIPRLSAV